MKSPVGDYQYFKCRVMATRFLAFCLVSPGFVAPLGLGRPYIFPAHPRGATRPRTIIYASINLINVSTYFWLIFS
jgi:hypothetical protein